MCYIQNVQNIVNFIRADVLKVANQTTQLGFGRLGTKSLRAGRLSYRTIEAVHRAIIGHFHHAMNLPITGKPTEVRIGRGKRNPTGWIVCVSTGQTPFEIDETMETKDSIYGTKTDLLPNYKSSHRIKNDFQLRKSLRKDPNSYRTNNNESGGIYISLVASRFGRSFHSRVP
ncbi:hypothetical protein Cgig2_028254 [Carnegiea gigantea]|uniref:Ribosomal protein L10e/L16 domain-containing protein n=1 Tax=Carnegiea gigantea TaxID=171969 RepID=A0A9Q1GLN1_9CARY|nr:hypothetical protein Cgig2_028254 [Carnegiea gigantea]